MSNVIMCSECKKADGDRCTYFDNDSDRESTIACILFEPKKPTLFDRITTSPEVLAEKLVFQFIGYDGNGLFHGYWKSTITDEDYATKGKAIAATVARLKEVEK